MTTRYRIILFFLVLAAKTRFPPLCIIVANSSEKSKKRWQIVCLLVRRFMLPIFIIGYCCSHSASLSPVPPQRLPYRVSTFISILSSGWAQISVGRQIRSVMGRRKCPLLQNSSHFRRKQTHRRIHVPFVTQPYLSGPGPILNKSLRMIVPRFGECSS